MKKIISLVLLAFILTPYTVFSQWFEQNSGTTMPLRGVYFIDENIGTIVGDFGTIIKTTNGGITWISQSSGTTVSLKAVFLVNENIGTVVGSEGTILRTTNGGENWISQTSGSGYELTGVSFSDEENAENHKWWKYLGNVNNSVSLSERCLSNRYLKRNCCR
jgi:hypothetical protein